MRVLCVENDDTTARSVELMLGDGGHACETTSLGISAVDLAQRSKFDLILLDMLLPDIDGFEVIRRLRTADVPTPVLIMSGLVERGSEFGVLAFGTSDYIAKPFTKDELMDCIETVISRSEIRVDTDPLGALIFHEGGDSQGAEQRQYRRLKTVMHATIEAGTDRLDCVVLNVSYGGAKIRLPEAESYCPLIFNLNLPSEQSRLCKLCWRAQDKVGVKFL